MKKANNRLTPEDLQRMKRPDCACRPLHGLICRGCMFAFVESAILRIMAENLSWMEAAIRKEARRVFGIDGEPAVERLLAFGRLVSREGKLWPINQ